MSDKNNVEYSLEDFTRVIKWYEFSDKTKKILKENIKNAPKKEYFFISSQWINDFKAIFQYEKLKFEIQSSKNKNETLTDKEIENLYQQIIPQTSISYEQKQKLKIIHNNNILQKNLYVNQNCIIKNYYNNFILIDKPMFDEFKKVYKIDEEIKFDLLLGSGIFIILITDKVIEIGIFSDNSIYQYELFLIIFSDEKEQNIETERIKKEGVSNYFRSYDLKREEITSKNLRKSNGKEIIIINLKNNQNNAKNKIDFNQNKINIVLNEIKEIDLFKKRGLVNFDKECSRLNSIIQLLTSIKEIKDYLFQNKEEISYLNHIYIVSSTLIKIFEQLYNKEENTENNVEKLNYILNFINPIQNKNQTKIDQYLLFILDILHDELNQTNLKEKNQINLTSFESPVNDENESLKVFENYYKEYYKSIIANNFNWIRKKNYMCSSCSSSLYSFQAFPFIEFDLDKTHEFTIFQHTEFKKIFDDYKGNKNLLIQKQNEYINKKLKVPIHITDCFKYYLNHRESLDINCNSCQQFTQNNCRNFIYKTPNYFCILLNRKEQIDGIKITLCDELKLENFVEKNNEYKRYKLLGLLVYNKLNDSEKHYSAIIRNYDQSWIKFDNDKKSKVLDEKSIYDSNTNARLLLYKGVKY